jgi:hypothetical protein
VQRRTAAVANEQHVGQWYCYAQQSENFRLTKVYLLRNEENTDGLHIIQMLGKGNTLPNRSLPHHTFRR